MSSNNNYKALIYINTHATDLSISSQFYKYFYVNEKQLNIGIFPQELPEIYPDDMSIESIIDFYKHQYEMREIDLERFNTIKMNLLKCKLVNIHIDIYDN